LENQLFHKDYVVNYTNAAFVVKPEFSFHDGLFSGYNKEKRAYDASSWDYEVDKEGKAVTDPTLEHPHCVFQLMKKHFSRYTPEMVENTTGVPKATFLKMAEIYSATGKPNKAGSLLYAMGGTQHTTGVQPCGGRTTSRAPRTWPCSGILCRVICLSPVKPHTPP
jgi:formate dehydrogenase major subunit